MYKALLERYKGNDPSSWNLLRPSDIHTYHNPSLPLSSVPLCFLSFTMSFAERTSLPILGSGKVVVESPVKEAPDVVHLTSLAPVLSAKYPAPSATDSTDITNASSDASEDEEEMEIDDFQFTAMQRCPSLTASQDSLSPSPTPSPNKTTFFGSVSITEAVIKSKSDKPATHGTVLVVGVEFVGAHLMERFSSAYEVVAFDVSENRCQYLRKAHCNNPNVTFISDLDADE